MLRQPLTGKIFHKLRLLVPSLLDHFIENLIQRIASAFCIGNSESKNICKHLTSLIDLESKISSTHPLVWLDDFEMLSLGRTIVGGKNIYPSK
jgi:hypothetical protein